MAIDPYSSDMRTYANSLVDMLKGSSRDAWFEIIANGLAQHASIKSQEINRQMVTLEMVKSRLEYTLTMLQEGGQ